MVHNTLVTFFCMVVLFIFGEAISITWPHNTRNSLRILYLGIFGLVFCAAVLDYYPDSPKLLYIIPPTLIGIVTVYGIRYEFSKRG